MAKLKWSLESISDLENIYNYIATDSPIYARHQIEHIFQAVERLRRFPESGRHLPEFQHLPHREIIVDSYRVIYRYESGNNEVVVITVVHGKRLLKDA